MYFKILFFFIFCIFLWSNDSVDSQENQKEIYFLRGQLQEIKQKQKNQELLKLKNGFFIGATIGNSVFEINSNVIVDKYYPLIIGIRGGYQRFFENTQAGFRIYLDSLVGVGVVEREKYIYQNETINFDVMADIMFDRNKKYGIGFFGGYGMGVINTYFKTKDYLDLGLFINFGMSIILNIRHRVDLYLKVPPLKDFGNTLKTQNLYLVTYNYVF